MGVKKSMSPSLLLLLFLSSLMNCSQQELIDDLLESLSKGVSFFEKQSGNINLDGVVGYVILQAQLLEATRSWPHSDFVSLSQRSTAMSLIKKLDRSLTHAVRSLQQTDPKYYKGKTQHKSLALKSTLKKCITQMCKCTLTACLVHLEKKWQKIGQKGCSRMLKGDMRLSRINITVEHYQRIFCSNMMKSNLDSISNGITGQIQDIFIENILLCGLAGFSDFYKADWLQHILQWQDRELGCFGKDEHCSQMFEEFLDIPHKRVKRREKTLKDGCSSHMTGVAVSTLGGYLNFYLSEQDITKRPLT
uniref:Uncharacterized protein n=1 Tax=Astyanax mexicanus TaxID=7994 RepID=A0A8B9JNQ4_ASTMX